MSVNPLSYSNYMQLSAFAAGCANKASEGDELANQLLFGAGLMGGGSLAFQGGAWLWQNRGNYRNAFEAIKENARHTSQTRSLIKSGSWKNPFIFGSDMYNFNKFNTIGNRIYQMPNTWDKYTDLINKGKTEAAKKLRLERFNNARKSACYSEARKELEAIKKLVANGKLKGPELRARLSKLNNLINKSDLKVLEGIKAGKIKPNGMWGKIAQKSGWNKMNRGLLKMATKEGKTFGAQTARVLGKGGKAFIKGGGPITFAIELGLETPEIIKTYKQFGAGKGTIQLGKSAAVAGASAVGWVVGAKAGAAIGTCIGGPVGTAVGGILGAGLGILASWGFGKGAKLAVGKSELEKAKDETRRKLLSNSKTEKGKVEILAQALQKVEGADQKILELIEKELNGREEAVKKSLEAIQQPENNIFST